MIYSLSDDCIIEAPALQTGSIFHTSISILYVFFAALICIGSACRRSAVSSMRPQAASRKRKRASWMDYGDYTAIIRASRGLLRNSGALSRSLFCDIDLARHLCHIFSAIAIELVDIYTRKHASVITSRSLSRLALVSWT